MEHEENFRFVEEDEWDEDMVEPEEEDPEEREIDHEAINRRQFSAVWEMAERARQGLPLPDASNTEENTMFGLPIEEVTVNQFREDPDTVIRMFLSSEHVLPLPDDTDEVNRIHILDSLNLISNTAKALSIPILQMKILAHFADLDNRLLVDEGLLTKQLVEIKKSMSNPKWRADNMKMCIPHLAEKMCASSKAVILRQKKRWLQEISAYTNKIDEASKRLREFHNKFGDMENMQNNQLHAVLSNTLDHVADNPFYTFLGFNLTHLKFLTQDIELTYDNEYAGVHQSYNFGRMIVSIPFSANGTITCLGGMNYPSAENFHPHVSGLGSICWGNASEVYPSLLAEGKIDQLLIIIQTLLTTYNPESPYMDLGVYCRGTLEDDEGEWVDDITTCRGPNWVRRQMNVTSDELSEYYAKLESGEITEIDKPITLDELKYQASLPTSDRTSYTITRHYITNAPKEVSEAIVAHYYDDSYIKLRDEDNNFIEHPDGGGFLEGNKIEMKEVRSIDSDGYRRYGTYFHAIPSMVRVTKTILQQHPLNLDK